MKTKLSLLISNSLLFILTLVFSACSSGPSKETEEPRVRFLPTDSTPPPSIPPTTHPPPTQPPEPKKPCPGQGSVAVNENYENDEDGDFCLVPNEQNGRFAASVGSQRIGIADPSITKIGDWYYLSGTLGESEIVTSNVKLYRSRDLVNWEFHNFAFDPGTNPSNMGDNRITLRNRSPNNSTRSFCHVWDGNLRRMGDRIALYFTALENRDGAGDYCTRFAPNDGFAVVNNPEVIELQSVYVVSISTADFESKSRYFAEENGGEPNWLGYNNNGWRHDGGLSASKKIPTTVHPSLIQFPEQNQARDGCRILHKNGNQPQYETSIHLAPFIFEDPKQNNRPYLIYNYVARAGSGNTCDGNELARSRISNNGNYVAMYPWSRTSSYEPDLQASNSDLIPLAGKKIQSQIIPGSQNIQEGCMARDGSQMVDEICVAEGGGIFYHPELDRYYFYVSRNAYDSASYAMFYRSATRLSDLSLGSFLGDANRTRNEQMFVSSTEADRQNRNGRHFGGGEIFLAYDQPYVVFHAKDAGERDNDRTPYLKELSFDANGEILALTNSNQNGRKQDLRYFRIPRPE